MTMQQDVPGARVKRRGSGRWLIALAILVALLFLLRVGLAPGDSESPGAPEPVEDPEADPAEVNPMSGGAPDEVLLFGRCVAGESEEGIAGSGVVVLGATSQAEATSGPDGRFEVPWRGGGPAAIRVLARPGWSSEQRELAPDELAGSTEIRLVVEADARARLLGRVIDARTGEGLPALALVVTTLDAPAESAILSTDSTGRFTSETELPARSLSIEVADEPPEGRVVLGRFSIDHSTAGPDALFEVWIGPTRRLRIAGGPPDGWKTRLVERHGDPELSGILWRTPGGWELGRAETEVDERPWSWLALRPGQEGELPFLRYPTIERDPDPSFSPFLELETEDGTHRGIAALDAILSEAGAPVAVTARRVGTLRGVLDTGGGTLDPDEVQLWLRSRGGAARGPWFVEENGSFEIDDLDPASYRLSVLAPLRAPVDVDFDLAQGITDLPPIAFPAADDAHAIRGLLECDRGHARGAVLVEIEGTEPRATRTLLLRIGGARVARTERFRVDDLPGGRYVVRTESIEGEHRFTPDEVQLVTPAPAMHFRCSGTTSSELLELDVHDARTGELLGSPRLELGAHRLLPFSWPESRPVQRWYHWPSSTRRRWSVSVPGYQPASGDAADPRVFTGSPRSLSVAMERGFGIRIAVRRESGEEQAVPDIRVRADGKPVGSTDERGELLLGLPDPPQRLELLHGSWKVVELLTRQDGDGLDRLVALVVPR